MMRCPPFAYVAPKSVDEVAAILAGEGPRARVLAGGTDLVPNMKRRHQNPTLLVSLRRVAELRERANGAGATLGAAVTLAEIAADDRLAPWRALRCAASSVATEHIRNVGTLGGNLCLDTRCNYYNQNYEWRKAIDFCMKEAGDTCWVAPGSPRCWAVSSTDTAPALIALDARVELVSASGARDIPLAELYADDGIHYLTRRPDELLARVILPDRSGWVSTYWKCRRRGSIDFPVLSVAAAARIDGGVVRDARIVFGAVSSRPIASEAAAVLVGQPLSDEAIDACAAAAAKVAKPLDNTDYTISWRKKVARAYVAGALRELRELSA
ncbi:MAG: 4-hydroxybenzoyl-CoA reductase [Deltaproteobacteria bacterium]|nr:MAG: 4-hydroxybenzoyl-CoA reductase [Deltaproteobacteria bacterium]